ncbi:MAG: 16S rRNA (cytidine(1402)-2'-O)-methyltransferase [Shimia sp.]
MNWRSVALDPGLWLVPTPLGNVRDITLRALDVLASATLLAAEDTRVLRRLMELQNIPINGRRLVSYHDHNGDRARPIIIEALKSGGAVAYCSDAGTPLISDPGFGLVRAALKDGFSVHALPGPCAAIGALTLSGLPSDRFAFMGFLPSKSSARREALSAHRAFEGTLIVYENPARVRDLLGDVCDTLGDRAVAVVRELTKRFEETRRGTCTEVLATLDDRPLKGECVVLIGGAVAEMSEAADVEAALQFALTDHRIKDAAALVAGAHGWSKRDVYQMALRLKGKD